MSEKLRFKAHLTLDVEYEIDIEECQSVHLVPEKVKAELVSYLQAAPDFLSGEGMLTHDLPATVESRDHRVEVS